MRRSASAGWLVCLLLANWLSSVLVARSLVCQRIPHLNAQQTRICQRSPELVAALRNGVQLALAECQQLVPQCSAWAPNRLYLNITDPEAKGSKQAALAHALFSAAVAYSLSEACTRSDFGHCSCGGRTGDSPGQLDDHWQWNGCAHNIPAGIELTRLFVDSVEHQSTSSPYSLANLHNNNVGRRVVRDDALVQRCQCHGLSGSCTWRTCWHTANGFRWAAQLLHQRYQRAQLVSYRWLLDAHRLRLERNARKSTARLLADRRRLDRLEQAFLDIARLELNQPSLDRVAADADPAASPPTKRDLVYLRPWRSAAVGCHRSNRSAIRCAGPNDTSQEWPPLESCDRLCCESRYRSRTTRRLLQCDCKFQFCCTVACRPCTALVTEFECD